MTALFVKCTGSTLTPASKAAQIAMEHLPRGVELKIEPKQPRNGKFHRMSWAFFTYVADALNDGPVNEPWQPDDVKDDLLVATGHCKIRPMSRAERARNNIPEGAKAFRSIPTSISWSAMDEVAFSRFMEAAMVYVRDDLCPWIEDSPHWAQIESILRASHLTDGSEPTP